MEILSRDTVVRELLHDNQYCATSLVCTLFQNKHKKIQLHSRDRSHQKAHTGFIGMRQMSTVQSGMSLLEMVEFTSRS